MSDHGDLDIQALGGLEVGAIPMAAVRLAKYDFRPLFTVRDFGIEPEAP